MLGDAVKAMALRAHQKGLELMYSVSPAVPDWIVADPLRLRQVLTNLLGNAIKFTERGEVSLTVDVEPLEGGDLTLHMRVRDTGIGIAPEALETALQPFGRVHNSAHPEIVGTGLGLPLTKALAEANRAKFEISSKPEKGTSVEIIFPVNRVLAG